MSAELEITGFRAGTHVAQVWRETREIEELYETNLLLIFALLISFQVNAETFITSENTVGDLIEQLGIYKPNQIVTLDELKLAYKARTGTDLPQLYLDKYPAYQKKATSELKGTTLSMVMSQTNPKNMTVEEVNVFPKANADSVLDPIKEEIRARLVGYECGFVRVQTGFGIPPENPSQPTPCSVFIETEYCEFKSADEDCAKGETTKSLDPKKENSKKVCVKPLAGRKKPSGPTNK